MDDGSGYEFDLETKLDGLTQLHSENVIFWVNMIYK